MKNITKIITLIIFFFLISCKENNQHKNIELIDLTTTLNSRDKVNLSEIASKIEYIKFEDDSISLISTLQQPNYNIRFSDDNIFVNSGGILRFNSKGKFLNTIGSIGKGPQEYVNADTFTPIYSGTDTIIAVYSAAQQKLLKYKLNGEFIDDFSINFWPMHVINFGENLVFVNLIGNRQPSGYKALSIISSNSGSIKKRLIYKEKERNIDLESFAMNAIYHLQDTLSYWEHAYDTIWRITRDFKTIPKYKLNIGNNTLPPESHVKEIVYDFNKYKKYDKLNRMHETKDYIFFSVMHKNRLHKIVYNKKTKQSSTVEFKRPFKKGIHFSFYNDIDGGVPFWPNGIISDKKVFMITYGYEIKDYISKKGENFDALDSKSRQKLLDLVSESKIVDNPMLMVVTLKNNL